MTKEKFIRDNMAQLDLCLVSPKARAEYLKDITDFIENHAEDIEFYDKYLIYPKSNRFSGRLPE